MSGRLQIAHIHVANIDDVISHASTSQDHSLVMIDLTMQSAKEVVCNQVFLEIVSDNKAVDSQQQKVTFPMRTPRLFE